MFFYLHFMAPTVGPLPFLSQKSIQRKYNPDFCSARHCKSEPYPDFAYCKKSTL